MRKYWFGFGVVFGVIGTLRSTVAHELGWTLVGLGATLLNLMALLGTFNDKIGE